MATDSASAPYPSPPSSPKKSSDPILRNAIRYTLSEQEYDAFRKFLATRAPRSIRRRALPSKKYESLVPEPSDYNATAIRASLRIFVVSQIGLKVWELISTRVLAKGRKPAYV